MKLFSTNFFDHSSVLSIKMVGNKTTNLQSVTHHFFFCFTNRYQPITCLLFVSQVKEPICLSFERELFVSVQCTQKVRERGWERVFQPEEDVKPSPIWSVFIPLLFSFFSKEKPRAFCLCSRYVNAIKVYRSLWIALAIHFSITSWLYFFLFLLLFFLSGFCFSAVFLSYRFLYLCHLSLI